jgi:hypothetical protein
MHITLDLRISVYLIINVDLFGFPYLTPYILFRLHREFPANKILVRYSVGLLRLIDQLASGSLMHAAYTSARGLSPLNPTPEAVEWARQPGAHEVPGYVWITIGLAEVGHPIRDSRLHWNL